MAYEQYKNDRRTNGKVLYYLHQIGVPLHIVEEVRIGQHTLTYHDKPFAAYHWTADDVPVFGFEGEYQVYTQLYQREAFNTQDRPLSEILFAGFRGRLDRPSLAKVNDWLDEMARKELYALDFGVTTPAGFRSLFRVRAMETAGGYQWCVAQVYSNIGGGSVGSGHYLPLVHRTDLWVDLHRMARNELNTRTEAVTRFGKQSSIAQRSALELESLFSFRPQLSAPDIPYERHRGEEFQ